MKWKIMFLAGMSLVTLLTTHLSVARAAESEVSTLTTQAAQTDTLTKTRGETAVSGKVSSDFKSFAGSTANSDALVSGLRNGSPITLTSTNQQGTTTSNTFTAPTGKMGYGNVFISLSLAKQQLVNAGINQPTGQQIQTSLLGGTVTTDSGQTVKLSGVAQMRSDGMGWGQIANTLGFKLGPVVSGIKSANANVAAQPSVANTGGVATTAGAANSAHARSSGIVSGTGGSVASSGGNGQGNAYGRGIVNAAGGSVVASGGSGAGNGNAYGRGIVTGGGSSGNAGGNSAAHSKGK